MRSASMVGLWAPWVCSTHYYWVLIRWSSSQWHESAHIKVISHFALGLSGLWCICTSESLAATQLCWRLEQHNDVNQIAIRVVRVQQRMEEMQGSLVWALVFGCLIWLEVYKTLEEVPQHLAKAHYILEKADKYAVCNKRYSHSAKANYSNNSIHRAS